MADKDVALLVTGWGLAELEKILTDFERGYGLGAGALKATSSSVGILRVRLGRSMPAEQVLFLVNYIHYPQDFDLTGRSPAAVAIARLNEPFGVSTPSPAGQLVTFYIPSNDTEYDEVYAKLETGATYRVSFADLKWETQTDGRQSSEVDALLRGGAALEAAASL